MSQDYSLKRRAWFPCNLSYSDRFPLGLNPSHLLHYVCNQERKSSFSFCFCFLFFILGCKEVGRRGEQGMVLVLESPAFYLWREDQRSSHGRTKILEAFSSKCKPQGTKWPCKSTVRYLPGEVKTQSLPKTGTGMILAVLLMRARNRKQAQCPLGGQWADDTRYYPRQWDTI